MFFVLQKYFVEVVTIGAHIGNGELTAGEKGIPAGADVAEYRRNKIKEAWPSPPSWEAKLGKQGTALVPKHNALWRAQPGWPGNWKKGPRREAMQSPAGVILYKWGMAHKRKNPKPEGFGFKWWTI